MEKRNRLLSSVIVLILIFLVESVSGVSSSINVNVVDTKALDIVFVRIDNVTENQFNSEILQFVEFFNKTYPVAEDELSFSIGVPHVTNEKEANPSRLIFNLDLKHILSFTSGTKRRIVGVLPEDWFSDVAGTTDGRRGEARIAKEIALSRSVLVEAINARPLAAHEIGHTFALCDEHDSTDWAEQDTESFTFDCPNGDSDNDDVLDAECDPNGCPTSTIGKLVPWNGSSEFIDLTNLMGNIDTGKDDTWISKESYIHLLNKFQESPSIAQKAVIANGIINRTDGTIELFTSYVIENVEITTQEENTTGNYSIKILDNGGFITSEINFTPSFLEVGLNGSTVETNISYFITVMNFTNTDKTIRVKENNITKDEVNRTANTPSLNITSDLSGKTFSKEIFNVTWDSTDADNDTVVYAVLFSEDDGGNYTTLEIDYNDTIISLNSSNLQDCFSCRIKILVTDGINTNSSLSDKFSIEEIPQNKFFIRNGSGGNVAWLGDNGDIMLKGSCRNQTTCVTNDGNSLIIANSTDNTVAFINSTGDLCVEKGDCSDLSASCNPTRDAFIIRNGSDYNMSYIDFDGDLCLTGSLFENSNP